MAIDVMGGCRAVGEAESTFKGGVGWEVVVVSLGLLTETEPVTVHRISMPVWSRFSLGSPGLFGTSRFFTESLGGGFTLYSSSFLLYGPLQNML